MKNVLYILAFLEGACVMVVELLSGKLMAPYFGTSLYIWSSVLGMTLLGLMLGYFFGGMLSKRLEKKRILYIVLIVAGLLTALAPYLGKFIMASLIDTDLRIGSVLSLLLYLVPPLICLGIVSPLIIGILSDKENEAGQNAGRVYGISTLGGILATFCFGFFLIPNYGLRLPALMMGGLVALLPFIILIKNRRIYSASLFLLIPITLFLNNTKIEGKNINVLYEQEGLLGQVKVIEHPGDIFGHPNKIARSLLVNNTIQTIVDRDNIKNSLWRYSYYFPAVASTLAENSKALIIGLGGGRLVNQLSQIGIESDAIEIDNRIAFSAREYFGIDPSVNIIVDDARHVLNITDKKYDIIFFDAFLSESAPENLLTAECFEQTKKLLNENGLVVINFYGFLTGELGLAARSLLKTLNFSGFKTKLLPTPGNKESRNMIFIASQEDIIFENINYKNINGIDFQNLENQFIDIKELSLNDAFVLTDDKPILSKLFAKPSLFWRKNHNQIITKKYFK